MNRCPRCGSTDIRGGKLSLERPEGSPFSTVALYDFYCRADGFSESMRSDAPKFKAWFASWQAPD